MTQAQVDEMQARVDETRLRIEIRGSSKKLRDRLDHQKRMLYLLKADMSGGITAETAVILETMKEPPKTILPILKAPAPVEAARDGAVLAGMGSQLNIWELLDILLPEEMLGLDITPGVQVGSEKKGRVLYDNVWIENGKVKCVRKGETRTLGYTPRFAKKKYKTKRRRKRLTKRDMYILEVLKANPQAGALALML